MKDNETIVEMITRFTDIVNGLEALVTYEINLEKKQQEGEDKKKKSITLKATTKEEEVEEEKQSEEDEDLALIIRKFNKFMRGEWFRRKTSLLEETFLKRNLHLMVTRKNGKRKEIWCVSSARN